MASIRRLPKAVQTAAGTLGFIGSGAFSGRCTGGWSSSGWCEAMRDWLGWFFSGGPEIYAAWRAAGLGVKLFFVAVLFITLWAWVYTLRYWERVVLEKRLRSAYQNGYDEGLNRGYQLGRAVRDLRETVARASTGKRS